MLDCGDGDPNGPGGGPSSSNQTELLGGKIVLSWSVNEENEDINFDVEVSGTGWVAIGLASSAGNMVGADAMIGAVVNGQAVIQDYKINVSHWDLVGDESNSMYSCQLSTCSNEMSVARVYVLIQNREEPTIS